MLRDSFSKHGDSASVFVAKVMQTYKSDENSSSRENWKELSSSTKSTKASFNDDSNEETLNVNRTRWQ